MYGMLSLVIFPMSSCVDCFSGSWAWPSWGRPGALMGQALVGPPGPLWAGPMRRHVGQALLSLPGPLRAVHMWALAGAPFALMSRALVGPLGPHGPGPSGTPLSV